MTKSGLGLILLLLVMMTTVAGCAVGPCAGYGCPAMTSTAGPPAKNAQTQQARTPSAQAQNETVRPTPSSGQ